MMRFLTTMMAIFLCAATLAAQQPTVTRNGEPTPQEEKQKQLTTKDLRFEFMKVPDAQGTYEVCRRMFGRTVRVWDDGQPNGISNLMQMDDYIVVHDTPQNVERILSSIKRFVKETTPEPERVQKPVRVEIRPQHLSIDEAVTALEPMLKRKRGNNQIGFYNATVLDTRGIILVNDIPDRVKEMQDLIKRLDVPRQQVLITCRIIHGYDPDDTGFEGDPKIAALVPEELKSLTPYPAFALLASGAARTAVGGDVPIEMEVSGADNVQARISIQPGAWSSQAKALTLRRVKFDFFTAPQPGTMMAGNSRQSLQTSTTLPANEIVVIGALGDDPIFVILELTPMKS